ncbi:MAG: FimB/Mfa2 family fimbrial subunit [Bacteroidaceae bacterium]|nr:FimB/Mfa2 family fimbrial subunit [Bacteroidaceae bacterium]
MKLLADIRKLALSSLGMLAVSAFMLTACDSTIYDYEGDCDPHFKVGFRYDMNMKFVDAFSTEVKSVSLYAFDSSGKFVKSFETTVESMASNNYMIDVDLAPGKYSLLAWCGLNDGLHSYDVPSLTPGSSTMQELKNTLKRQAADDGTAVVGEIDQLYHGIAEADFPDEEGVHTAIVPLTKDTNRVKVVLQNLSENNTMSMDDFKIFITAENGKMDYDNSLMTDELLTYVPYYSQEGSSEIIVTTRDEQQGEGKIYNLLMTEMNTARLVKNWQTPYKLHITDADGNNLITVSLVELFLLVKGKENQSMDDQEYLDREDDFNMTFFLYNAGSDEKTTYIGAEVIINDWKIVMQDVDF